MYSNFIHLIKLTPFKVNKCRNMFESGYFVKEFLFSIVDFYLFTVHVVPELLHHSPSTPSTQLLSTLFGLRGNFDQPPPPIQSHPQTGVRCHNMSPCRTPKTGFGIRVFWGVGFGEKRFHKSSPHKGSLPLPNMAFWANLLSTRLVWLFSRLLCQFQPRFKYV